MNQNQKITIELDGALKDLPCYCEMTIVFHEGENSYTIAVDDLHTSMLQFKNNLEQVLKFNISLDQSLIPDPGYVYNEYLKYSLEEDEVVPSPNLKFTHEDGFEMWVGFKAMVWSYGSYATWLYNKDKAIVLQITPFYSRQNRNTLAYKEWLKSYKPIITTTISREVAENWLKKVNEIIDFIEKKIGQPTDNEKRIYEVCPRTYKLD